MYASATPNGEGYLPKGQYPGLVFSHSSQVWHLDSLCFCQSCGILEETSRVLWIGMWPPAPKVLQFCRQAVLSLNCSIECVFGQHPSSPVDQTKILVLSPRRRGGHVGRALAQDTGWSSGPSSPVSLELPGLMGQHWIK